MRELKPKDKIEIAVKKKQQIEHQLLGKVRPRNGHKVFEINIETLEVNEAKFSPVTALVFGVVKNKEIIIKKNHVYISALNKKNALKKFSKTNSALKTNKL